MKSWESGIQRQRKGCEKSPERTNWEDGDIRNQCPGEGRIQNDVEMSCVWVTGEKNGVVQEFPGSPVVRAQHFHYQGPDSIPDQGTKIPQSMWCNQKKRKWQCLYQNKKIQWLPSLRQVGQSEPQGPLRNHIRHLIININLKRLKNQKNPL